MQHIIKKQIIDLTLNQKMDAFAVQHLVSERYWHEIVPVLQKALDGISAEDEIYYLDKLEIDLGIINVKDIEKGRWNDDVFKKVAEQLSLLTSGPSSEKKVKKPKTLSVAEQWLFYMEHGFLPWNILQISNEWYKNVLEAFAVNSVVIEKLRSLIRTNFIAANRIVFQHSHDFLKALLETLTAEKQDKLPELVNEMAQVILFLNLMNESHLLQKKQLVQKLWFQAFQISVSRKENLNSSKLIVDLLKRNIPDDESGKNLSAKHSENKINLEEGIFVQHAGIVLLHPFLNMFFKNLEIVKENAFINESAHQKALFLLHYLATGLTTANEHELVIEKILCQWPLEKPVNNLIQIAADDLKEADELLTEVIYQWKILKKTSFAGLREGFLDRNGKLYTRNNNLHLQIEASAIDVLLDQLPWNLSVIKLPWMNDILRVEWR